LRNRLADIVRKLFSLNTTLGIRTFSFIRIHAREFGKLILFMGGNRKTLFYNGKEVSVKPEYDECKRIASRKRLYCKESI